MKPPSKSDSTVAPVALVTGGAKRVGRAIALTLAQAGYDVAITYQHSRSEALDTVHAITQCGRQALAIPTDLSKPDHVQKLYAAFAKRFAHLHVLINNASGFTPSPMGQITLAQLQQQMMVNAWAPLLLMQKFAPMLAAGYPHRPGRVVNFIDIHVMGQPLKHFMAYNLSKAALHEVTMTAALELAPHITVNAIAPGVVAWADSYTPAERRRYMKRVPLARPGTPEDAAKAVLFLVRDADYCTGQIIRLDGGRLWT